jgi:hypothetical protein
MQMTTQTIDQQFTDIISTSQSAIVTAILANNNAKEAAKGTKEVGAVAFGPLANLTLALALEQGVSTLERDIPMIGTNECYTIEKLARMFFPQLKSLTVAIVTMDSNERALYNRAAQGMIASVHCQVTSLSGAMRALLAKVPSGNARAALEHERALEAGYANAVEYKLAMIKEEQEAQEARKNAPLPVACPIEGAFTSAKQALLQAIASNDWAVIPAAVTVTAQAFEAFEALTKKSDQERAILKVQQAAEAQEKRHAEKLESDASLATQLAAKAVAKANKAIALVA